MPQTITEKIIAAHSRQSEVHPGERVVIQPDLVIMSERTAYTVMRSLEQMGVEKLYDPAKVVIGVDHTVQSAATAAPIVDGNRQVRAWAADKGIGRFYDIGKGGLRHQVVVENGLIGAGMLCVTDEPNLDNMGALGALAVWHGKYVWELLAAGELEVRIPETLRCLLNGTLGAGVSTWDLGALLRRDLGGYGGIGKVVDFGIIRKIIEFDGPGLASLSIDWRMDLLAMYPVGMGIMNPDQVALEWTRAHGGPADHPVRSDPDAQCEASFEYDLSSLGPQVSPPPSERSTIPVGDVDRVRLDQAVVGSCDNGRIDDLRAVAQVLRGRQVHPSVRMYIAPITQKVYAQAAREGLLEIFSEAGAVVLTAGCGTCWGYVGQLADGETCVSTTQHNYAGRMGSSKAEIYLAGPYTVAASAIEGKIVDPRPYIQAAEPLTAGA
jgi:3-isopropylmalate/(R)-2-methylmalate dehydratase large subunit